MHACNSRVLRSQGGPLSVAKWQDKGPSWTVSAQYMNVSHNFLLSEVGTLYYYFEPPLMPAF